MVSLGANHRSAQVLVLLVIPGHLIFLYTIHLMKSGHTTLTPIFTSVYLATALLQVSTVCSGIQVPFFLSSFVWSWDLKIENYGYHHVTKELHRHQQGVLQRPSALLQYCMSLMGVT